MNATQFTYLLNNTAGINPPQNVFLEKIIAEFPYLQSARALQLKNLFKQNSFQYNQELRKTAAYTADRSVLFEFITSNNFASIQKDSHDEKQAKIKEINVNDFQEIIFEKKITSLDAKTLSEKTNTKLEQSIIDSISESNSEAVHELNVIKKEASENNLALGQPLVFPKNEKHSFQEWLQLAHYQPIDRTKKLPHEAEMDNSEKESQKRNQAIIDKFIETNPKITPIKNYNPPAIADKTTEDNSHIMTETLAKVYLEQKKYQKAIQAYEILILKYPEKFSFFANRISDIKKLQQNNN